VEKPERLERRLISTLWEGGFWTRPYGCFHRCRLFWIAVSRSSQLETELHRLESGDAADVSTCLRVAFTGNKRPNALHGFVGGCGCPFRPERYPENIRTEYRCRISWIVHCRVFRPGSPPLRYLVPTGDGTFLRKLQCGYALSSQPWPPSQ